MLGRVIVVQEESVRGRQDRVQAMGHEMTLEKHLVMQTATQTQLQLLLEGAVIDLVCVSSSLDPYSSLDKQAKRGCGKLSRGAFLGMWLMTSLSVILGSGGGATTNCGDLFYRWLVPDRHLRELSGGEEEQ